MIFSFGSFYSCSFVLINWPFLILKLYSSSRSGRTCNVIRAYGDPDIGTAKIPRCVLAPGSTDRGFQITSKPVASVPGASGKPAVNCQPRFVTAEGEKGALRLLPPPESRHEVRRHSTRWAVPMDDGGCNRGHLGLIKGTARKLLIRAGLFCGRLWCFSKQLFESLKSFSRPSSGRTGPYFRSCPKVGKDISKGSLSRAYPEREESL